MPQVSRFAIIEPSAELGGDVVVGPFSYVGANVTLGNGCVIGNNVTLTGKTILGERCHVFPLAVIGVSQNQQGNEGTVEIGEANTIREHVTIYGGSDGPTRVGNHNLIMIASQVGPGAMIGDHGIFDNCCYIYENAIVDDYVRMSGQSTVQPGTHVGAYSFVTGYAVVDHDAPPYAMMQGNPARVRGVNRRNLKACGFGEQDISLIKSAFRELFNRNVDHVNEDALDRLASQESNPYVQNLVACVRASLAKRQEPGDV